MSDREEKGSKRQKTSNEDSVGVSGAVRECLLAVVEAVIARTLSSAAASQRVETAATTANPNDKTPTASNTTFRNEEQFSRPTKRVVIVNLENGTDASSLVGTSASNSLSEVAFDALFDEGYDSDGQLYHYGNAEIEKLMQENLHEDELPSTAQRQQDNEEQQQQQPEQNDNLPTFILIPDSELKKMRVDVLKKECKKRNLPTSGRKAELLERLQKAMVDQVPIATTGNAEAPQQQGVFSTGAYWQFLKPCEEPVQDPTEHTSFYAPTDSDKVKAKVFNYSVAFD